MSIIDLPPELVLKILLHASVADILHFTRTCSYLRQISLYNRQIWKNARDSHIIPLPPGNTLDTVDLTFYPYYASRAISLSVKWKTFTSVPPLKCSEARHLYHLPSWEPWIPQGPGTLSPTVCYILPGSRYVLLGRLSEMRDIPTNVGIYDLKTAHGHLLDYPGRLDSLDWVSTDNGAHITISILLTVAERGPTVTDEVHRRLRIFSLDCSTALSQDDSSPQIVQTGDIRLPPGSFARSVVLRDSLACLHGGSELFFIDINLKSGICVSPRPERANGIPSTSSTDVNFDIDDVFLHPRRQCVLLLISRRVFVQDLSWNASLFLEVYDTSSLEMPAVQGEWVFRTLKTTTIASLNLVDILWKDHQMIRLIDSNITAFEVFSRAVERNENEYEEADDEIKLKLYTYLIDEESWSLVSDKPSISILAEGTFTYRLMISKAPSGQSAMFMNLYAEKHRVYILYSLAMGDGPIDDLRSLQLPDGIRLTSSALAFDDVSGTLITYAKGHLLSIQY